MDLLEKVPPLTLMVKDSSYIYKVVRTLIISSFDEDKTTKPAPVNSISADQGKIISKSDINPKPSKKQNFSIASHAKFTGKSKSKEPVDESPSRPVFSKPSSTSEMRLI